MVEIPAALTFTCVDAYEVAPASGCPVVSVGNGIDTEQNIAVAGCQAVSQAKRIPWRYVTRAQAQQLCARAGKRLPTAEEWYQFAIDTQAGSCRVSEGVVGETGAAPECRTREGVFDGVGNVWEWVADDVTDGQFRGRALPSSGYVSEVDAAGVATLTDPNNPSSLYDEAYFWSQNSGTFGMIRGGFYGSRDDAGVYAVHAYTQPSFVGEAIGFRCVR